ncbi:MAG: hypothetical protein JJE40_00945 [Vicinamibacteria bacterium]|nr:hypothetical protein [Vicinamibacteria bacterium]
MTRADLIAFARRDWAALDEEKARTWRDRKRSLGVEGALGLADQLRRHVLAVRPEWPTSDERSDDLRHHVRVSEALAATRGSS